MKKVLFYSLVVSSILYSGQGDSPDNSESGFILGINGGVTSIRNEGGLNYKNGTAGLTIQRDVKDVKIRGDFTYVKVDEAEDPTVTSMSKVSLNGVYNFDEKADLSPYIVAGAGYEFVEGERPGNESNAFLQAGAGVEYKLNDKNLKAKMEAKALQIVGSKYDENNEFSITAGLSMPFGVGGVQKDFDDNECPVKISGPDQDRDGVLDSLDQCPNTPCDFIVDDKGCPIKAELEIHFTTDSSAISPVSMQKVRNFATFLLRNKGSMVKLIGHCDYRGSDAYNMGLSNRRAKSLQTALVGFGVSINRLTTEGRGEREPKATNSTVAGMAMNRRTEVQLTYPADLNR